MQGGSRVGPCRRSGEAGGQRRGWGGVAEVVVAAGRGAVGVGGVAGLTGDGAGEVVEVLEADASFEADVVPGAGAVVVGVEEVVDVAEVFVDVEQQVAGPSALEERGVGWQALLELVDVVLEVVEEVVSCLGVPVLGGGGAAEGGEEVLEDAEGGGGGLLWVVGVEEGVGEEGRLLVVAGLWGAGSHGLEELEAVPGEGGVAGTQVVAGEGGGESRQEEQERRGAVRPAGLWGCGRSHGGAVGAAWVVLGRRLVRLGVVVVVVVRVGAVLGVLAGWPALCGATALPSSLSDCSEFPAVVFGFVWWLWWSRGSALVGWPRVGRAVAVLCWWCVGGEVGCSG